MFESKDTLVRELLDLMSIRSKYEQIAIQVSKRFSAYGMDVGDVVREAALSTIDDLYEDTVKLYYEKHDKVTLKGVIKFYKSGVGKRFVELSPIIDQELILLSTQWQTKVLDLSKQLMLKEKVERGINPTDYIPALEL